MGNEMSKVKKNLVAVNLKNGNFKIAVFIALSLSLENGSVYLPNAYDEVKIFMTKHQFAGYLSALAKDGKYYPLDDGEFFGFWGKINNANA
jgi:hypothetical protein